jgi:hypothetical protein
MQTGVKVRDALAYYAYFEFRALNKILLVFEFRSFKTKTEFKRTDGLRLFRQHRKEGSR